ncbi:MAG TPA: arylsulfatase, partial [Phycisphaerae bacterium]|nr:arylsulfatase [Phycisphaerae bacterium]
ELYFDLDSDPDERFNLAGDPKYASEIARWRRILVEELRDRPEGFTDGEKLTPVGGDTPFYLPGFERKEE